MVHQGTEDYVDADQCSGASVLVALNDILAFHNRVMSNFKELLPVQEYSPPISPGSPTEVVSPRSLQSQLPKLSSYAGL
jgi:hypothetical protein